MEIASLAARMLSRISNYKRRAVTVYSSDVPRVRAGRVDEFPPERPVLVVLDGRRLALVRRGDAVHALDDACPHAGGPLSEGALHGNVLTCPYHGWMWNVHSGACVAPDRPARVAVYPTHVEDGEVWIDLP